MTTLSLSSLASMANTAALRSLGSELNGYLSTVGLVQTADSGQINWSTVVLPAGNTLIGYEVWRFADSSIFFSLSWTTASTATNTPIMKLIVGTGSNGSGTITGQLSSTFVSTGLNTAIVSTTTNYTSYVCATADSFGLIWKAGASGPGLFQQFISFTIEKTVDSTGTADGSGYVVTFGGLNTASLIKQSVRIASPATTFAATTSYCAVPGNITNSSTAAGSKQVFLHQHPIPDIQLSNVVATIVAAEATIGTTFTATLVGTTPQTMISCGNQFGAANSSSFTATWGMAMRWQ